MLSAANAWKNKTKDEKEMWNILASADEEYQRALRAAASAAAKRKATASAAAKRKAKPAKVVTPTKVNKKIKYLL